MSLLECLVLVSEKAANIARKIREEKHLFDLLVEEKGSGEANPRFMQDFKTLADVLIQQTVKHDVGRVFPEINDHIKGEESNVFSNKLGESIVVDILETTEDTAGLLEKVLDGDRRAAELLSAEVHKEIDLEDIDMVSSLPDNIPLDTKNLGIWIDPIDSTAEYINGTENKAQNNIHLTGLRCVTVLIGVYNRTTGEPVMGVINQPFFEPTRRATHTKVPGESSWKGRCYWGISLPDFSRCSDPPPSSSTNILCLSSSESDTIKSKLKENGYELAEAAGAGYKLLSVIIGEADAYILTKSSTFKWDTCGPQAILKSLGGDLLVYSKTSPEKFTKVSYLDGKSGVKIEKCCNEGGILAYREEGVIKKILRIIDDL